MLILYFLRSVNVFSINETKIMTEIETFINPTKILINLTDYHVEELDQLVSQDIYQNRTEAIQDVARRLIERRI